VRLRQLPTQLTKQPLSGLLDKLIFGVLMGAHEASFLSGMFFSAYV
jgi:hypothetical protein